MGWLCSTGSRGYVDNGKEASLSTESGYPVGVEELCGQEAHSRLGTAVVWEYQG